AIFASRADNVWREFDLPPRLLCSELIVNRRFHLRPLVAVLAAAERTGVVLADRKRARIFELAEDQLRELEDFQEVLPRWGRSDGFAGYDAGHNQRHVENHAIHHLKRVFERAFELHQIRGWQHFLVGCRDETWPEVEPHLHPYLRHALAG